MEHALAVGVLECLGDLESDPCHAAEESAVGVGPGQRVGRGAGEADHRGVRRPGREWRARRAGPTKRRPAWSRARGIPSAPSAGENRPVRIASATSAALTAPWEGARRPGALALPRPPQPAQFLQDGVQAHAGDELHDVVVMAVVPAHAEDRDDVGVVQPRRGPRLSLEPQYLLPIAEGRIGEDLQRHPPAQRLLLGLVDHTHSAAADLAENAVVAQPRQPGLATDGNAAGGVVGAVGAEVLHADQYREDLADLVGEFGVAPAVFLERRPFAAALTPEEVVGHRLDGVAVAAAFGWCVHLRVSSKRQGWDGGFGSPAFVHAGNRGEDFLEPLQRPDVSVARGLVGEAEHQRGVFISQ